LLAITQALAFDKTRNFYTRVIEIHNFVRDAQGFERDIGGPFRSDSIQMRCSELAYDLLPAFDIKRVVMVTAAQVAPFLYLAWVNGKKRGDDCLEAGFNSHCRSLNLIFR
jgi:hypothetical protein